MWVTPSCRFLRLLEFSGLVIISQFSRAMEEGQRAIAIPMDLHSDSDIVAAVLICRDLERHSLKSDAVIGADRPVVVFTEDIVEIFSYPGDKC